MRYKLLYIFLIGILYLAIPVNVNGSSNGMVDSCEFFHEEEYKVVNEDVVTNLRCWIMRNIFHVSIPMHNDFYNQNKRENRNVIVYLDTMKQIIHCTLLLRINKTGKIAGCDVKGIKDEILIDRIKSMACLFPKKILSSKNMKRKGESIVNIKISIPLEGNYGFLDNLPIYNKNSNKRGLILNEYVTNVYTLLAKLHPWEEIEGVNSTIGRGIEALSGKLRYCFVINGDGRFSLLRSSGDLFPDVFGMFVRNTSKLVDGYFSESVKWEPAMFEGKVVPVRIIVDYNYDIQTYSWRCYLL